MRNNPLPQVTLSVIRDLMSVAPDVKTRLRNKIMKDKIRATVSALRRVQERGQGGLNLFRTRLQKLVLQATSLKRPDPELLELLREVENIL